LMIDLQTNKHSVFFSSHSIMSKSRLSKDVDLKADQTEVLFLLSKLLSSLNGFENSAAAIKDDLVLSF
jgi:hypothetical protein